MNRIQQAQVSLRDGTLVEWAASTVSASIGLQLAFNMHPLASIGVSEVLFRFSAVSLAIQGGALALVALASALGRYRNSDGLIQTAGILSFCFYLFVACGMVRTWRVSGAVIFGSLAALHCWRVSAHARGGQDGRRRGAGTGHRDGDLRGNRGNYRIREVQ